MSQKTALITGITGQDGAYLARSLVDKGYRVVGAVRRSSTLNLPRLVSLEVAQEVELKTLDMQDFTSIVRLIEEVEPNEIIISAGKVPCKPVSNNRFIPAKPRAWAPCG